MLNSRLAHLLGTLASRTLDRAVDILESEVSLRIDVMCELASLRVPAACIDRLYLAQTYHSGAAQKERTHLDRLTGALDAITHANRLHVDILTTSRLSRSREAIFGASSAAFEPHEWLHRAFGARGDEVRGMKQSR